MIVCLCRAIYEEDFETPEELKNRVMEEDFVCGQCQLRYMLANSKDEKSIDK